MHTEMIATEITTATRIGTRLPIATIDQAVQTASMLSPTAMEEPAASRTDVGGTKTLEPRATGRRFRFA
jgi:hypothetical protein